MIDAIQVSGDHRRIRHVGTNPLHILKPHDRSGDVHGRGAAVDNDDANWLAEYLQS